MFGRKVALTLVKKDKNDSDTTTDSMPIQQLGETIVETAEGVGAVVIVVATTLTVLRVTERVINHVFR